MRILFVQPHSRNEVVNCGMHIYNFEPLGLYYLAAAVKDHHDVMLLDLNNEMVLRDAGEIDLFAESVQTYQPDVVAFSALTSVRTGRIVELSRRAKRWDCHV